MSFVYNIVKYSMLKTLELKIFFINLEQKTFG